MIPTWNQQRGGATLSLDFINNDNVLDSRITFTRASSATYYNSAGTLVSAAINVPRFDYNPSTLAARGLLIEEQRTNLLLQSADFGTSWSASRGTVTTNGLVAPDGTTTGDTFAGNGAVGGTQGVFQSALVSSSTAYSMFVYAKAGTTSWITIQGFDGTTTPRAWFDITNGTVGTVESGMSNGQIVSVGNGWFRCSVVRTTGVAAISLRTLIGLATANGVEATSSFLTMNLWGAQTEAGAFATSYIPTTTAAATRSQDVATMTGTNFSSWYNATQGTLIAEATPNVPSTNPANQVTVSIDDGTTNNRIQLYRTTSSTAFSWLTQVSGSTTYQPTAGTWATQTTGKIGQAYANLDERGAYNGVLDTTAGAGTIPLTVNQMHLGIRADLGVPWNGWLRSIRYYPTRLPNGTLQGLTA